jgi:hypothetical protein
LEKEMTKRRSRLSDLERREQAVFYLVEITWNDGVRTLFAIQSKNAYEAQQATGVKALNMWDGFVTHIQVTPIPIPVAVNYPEHIRTDYSSYKEPQKA